MVRVSSYSNRSVDPKRIWMIFGRNAAREIYTLLMCTITYYLIMQLGTVCVAMVTDLKKRRAEELMAVNCIT